MSFKSWKARRRCLTSRSSRSYPQQSKARLSIRARAKEPLQKLFRSRSVLMVNELDPIPSPAPDSPSSEESETETETETEEEEADCKLQFAGPCITTPQRCARRWSSAQKGHRLVPRAASCQYSAFTTRPLSAPVCRFDKR
jgi:hypothetical protein